MRFFKKNILRIIKAPRDIIDSSKKQRVIIINMKRFGCVIVAAILTGTVFCGCANKDNNGNNHSGENIITPMPTIENAKDADDMAKEISADFKVETEITDGFTLDNGTLNIGKAGAYTLSGNLQGNVVVDLSEDANVEITMADCVIESSEKAPIYIENAKNAIIILEKDTYNEINDLRNRLPDTEDAVTDATDAKAAIFSDCDLKIRGEGALKVTGNAKNGIHTKDDLTISDAVLKVSALNHALRGNDSVTIKSGDVTINTTEGDGIHSEQKIIIDGGKTSIDVKDDGMHADGEIIVNDGTLNVVNSYEGIEADIITFNGGRTVVYATDDGINASSGTQNAQGGFGGFGGGRGGMSAGTSKIVVNGGYVEVKTPSGDTDAIDANGSYVQTGGFVLVKGGSSSGNMSGSVDVDGTVEVTGGMIAAFGGICELPSGNSCNTYAMRGTSFGSGEYSLNDNEGNSLLTFNLDGNYSSAWICGDILETNVGFTLTKDGEEIASWVQTEGNMSTGNGNNQGGPGGFNPGGRGNKEWNVPGGNVPENPPDGGETRPQGGNRPSKRNYA